MVVGCWKAMNINSFMISFFYKNLYVHERKLIWLKKETARAYHLLDRQNDLMNGIPRQLTIVIILNWKKKKSTEGSYLPVKYIHKLVD